MLSLTWNAPIEAFTREGDFFEGKGVDDLYMHFHKANEFLGMIRLPSFICNDVIKAPGCTEIFGGISGTFRKSVWVKEENGRLGFRFFLEPLFSLFPHNLFNPIRNRFRLGKQ